MLPLMEREIPVIADDAVDPEFGTGAVKVTPAHDPNDNAMALRHRLAEIVVIGKDGNMTAEAGQYAGLDRYDARKRVVADLEERGLLEAVQEYTHTIPQCSRCDTILERWCRRSGSCGWSRWRSKDWRWWTAGGVRFVPERWTKVYRDWLENIRDWPISRQLWWGHSIPVWYCDECGRGHLHPRRPDRLPEVREVRAAA